MLPLFLDNRKTQSVVVCNSGQIGPIVDDMKTMFGLELKLFDTYEDTFLNFEWIKKRMNSSNPQPAISSFRVRENSLLFLFIFEPVPNYIYLVSTKFI